MKPKFISFNFLIILFIFIILIFILIPKFSYSRELVGLGISPSCFPSAGLNGKCDSNYNFTQHLTNLNDNITIEFRVYNFDNTTRDFEIRIESVNCSFNNNGLEIINNLTSPNQFTLTQNLKGLKCEESPGCQNIKVVIPYDTIKSGDCVLNLLAISPEQDQNTMLKINQIIGAKIHIYKEDDFLIKNKNIIFIIFGILIFIIIILSFKHKRNKKQRKKKNEINHTKK